MRRVFFVLAGVAIVSIATERILSGQTNSTSSSLTVNATVSKNCTITTAPVSFGAYDPVGTNAATPRDAVGTITVTCTKGAEAHVGLGVGSNAQGTTRRMSQGATADLTYELYKDSSHTTVWGDTTDTGLPIPAAPNRAPRDFPVYGRVAAAQDVTVGTYTDTVVATVNF